MDTCHLTDSDVSPKIALSSAHGSCRAISGAVLACRESPSATPENAEMSTRHNLQAERIDAYLLCGSGLFPVAGAETGGFTLFSCVCKMLRTLFPFSSSGVTGGLISPGKNNSSTLIPWYAPTFPVP